MVPNAHVHMSTMLVIHMNIVQRHLRTTKEDLPLQVHLWIQLNQMIPASHLHVAPIRFVK
jgi:hypothetical protein